jgi:hypothetical protein
MTVAQRATAARMIASKGQTVTIEHTAPGGYDPATGTMGGAVISTQGKAVIFPFSTGLRMAPNSSITTGTEQCYLSGLAVDGSPMPEPAVDDVLIDAAGVRHTISDVAPLSPAGLDIIYDLTITGGAT